MPVIFWLELLAHCSLLYHLCETRMYRSARFEKILPLTLPRAPCHAQRTERRPPTRQTQTCRIIHLQDHLPRPTP